MAKRKKLKIGLIFGGTSEEREVSLRSGQTIAQYLDPKKYDIIPVEVSRSGKWLTSSATIRQIGKSIRTEKAEDTRQLVPIAEGTSGIIDVALLALHGPGGEDGTIQGMLELLGIPYTGSGVLASAVAMDKARAKRLAASCGVPVLRDVIVSKREFRKIRTGFEPGFPGKVVIKPNKMGSSIGITIASDKKAAVIGLRNAFRHDTEAIVEPFMAGREITVPVFGNASPKALPVIEIVPWKKSGFYDYSAKYQTGGSDHIIPAPLSPSQTKLVQKYALAAHRALGCRGITRSDFILDEKGRFWFLEINTIPGMTPTSLAPQSAAASGLPFGKFLDKLIKLALEKG